MKLKDGSKGRRRWWITQTAIFLFLTAGVPASATVRMTQQEALRLVFPGCEIERQTVYLTPEQMAEAAELAGEEMSHPVVRPYRALCDGEPGGTAYFDTHRVRTLPETLMVAVDAAGRLKRVEVLVFREPPDYLPRDAWYRLFDGKALSKDLRLKRDIPVVAGATLTSRATEGAVRRALAIHRVLEGGEVGSGEPGRKEPRSPGSEARE